LQYSILDNTSDVTKVGKTNGNKNRRMARMQLTLHCKAPRGDDVNVPMHE
jgi:hypothetical protein